VRSHALEVVQLVAVVLGSSAAWYLVGRRALGLPRSGMRAALARLVEWVGLTVLFYVANVAFGMALTLGLRTTGAFVSMYGSTDVTLLLLASLQAFVLRAWMD
jgi:hypothetical protein